MSLLPDSHKPLFHLLPFLLHVNNRELPGYVDNDKVPYGLYNYTLRPDVTDALEKLFPELTPIDEFAKTVWPRHRCIESILLMGSVGTIAQDENSDFDYWVCVDETRYTEHQLSLLKQKIALIELWAEQNYNLEVHFFLSDINRVRRNDFGVADGESAGSAQAVFLKAEFYTTNIVVAGKAPFWWITPNNASDEQYQSLYDTMLKTKAPNPTWLMDLGNLEAMDPNELFGAALWQLSKAMDSPFKSVLKMAKLEVFLENINDHQPLCNELKQHVHQADVGTAKYEPIDPYALMFDQLIQHYTNGNQGDVVELLRECLYIKSHCLLSRRSANQERNFKHHIMSLYTSKWGWSERKIHDLDNIDRWSFRQHVNMSKRIHSFLLQCYRRMSAKFKDHNTLVSQQDMTVLGRRLETFYAKKNYKIGMLRSSFGEEMYCKIATIKVKRSSKGERKWMLFAGDQITAPDNVASRYLVRADLSSTRLVTWCAINKIIDGKTKIMLDYDAEPVTEENINELSHNISVLFRPQKISNIPRELLLSPRSITHCLAILNLETARIKANVQQVDLIYATNWGEYYLESGLDLLAQRTVMMAQQEPMPKMYVYAPNYNHKKRLIDDFLDRVKLPFKVLQ